MSEKIKNTISSIKRWLSGLSFRTGVTCIAIAAVCYILSFAQILLPISATAKGIIWVIFFGLAKTFQYSGLAILGANGLARLKSLRKRHKK